MNGRKQPLRPVQADDYGKGVVVQPAARPGDAKTEAAKPATDGRKTLALWSN